MPATVLGVELTIGVGQTFGSYVLESITKGDDDVKFSDVFEEEGVLNTRIIMQIMDKVTITMFPITGADPETDFAKGTLTAIEPFSNYWVDAMTFDRVEDASKVVVTLINIGVT